VSTATIPAAKPSKQADPSSGQPVSSLTQNISDRHLLKWMFQFIKPVKAYALLACFYLVLGVGIEVLMPRQMGEVMDRIDKLHYVVGSEAQGFWNWFIHGDVNGGDIRFAVFMVVGLVVASAFIGYLRNVSSMKLSMNMVYYIREATYDKLQHAGFTFHDTISSGQLINRALGDLQNVRSFLQTCVLTVLEILLIVTGFIILLLTRQPWVALISLVPLPIWTWYILRFSKKVQPVAKSQMEAGDRNVQIITENIAGVHVIKAFATEKTEITKYGKNCDELWERTRQRIHLFANFNPVIRSIATVTQLGLAYVVSVLVLKQKMTIGDFLIVGWAMGAILGRLQQVSAINDQYQNAIVSAKRLYEILAAKPSVVVQPDAPPLPEGQGGVEFRDVTFGYDAAKPVLRSINLAVKPGSMVAIVGPTGSGKSTLVNLLARFYDPQQGWVLIDGADVRDIDLSSLRTEVTFVFQETFLFSDTIANNIAYGKPDATPGDIEIAARLAQAHDFIEELPKGYQTVLAERGSSLSGGQRQRLAIARAILKNPRILVLDDATAAVDPGTEDLIRRGMKFVMCDCTTFVIAHRLSTVQAADLVIVIENGEITQRGTHEQLLQQDGHYREIAAVQLYSDAEGEAAESPSHMRRIHSRKTYATAAADVAKSSANQKAAEVETE
jgi:ATP-binding cassette, subfamily B, bacterial